MSLGRGEGSIFRRDVCFEEEDFRSFIFARVLVFPIGSNRIDEKIAISTLMERVKRSVGLGAAIISFDRLAQVL